MTQQIINIGNVGDDGTGDPIRTAFDKANDNFTELYSTLADRGWASYTDTTYTSGSPLSVNNARVQATIDAATKIETYLPDEAQPFWDSTSNTIQAYNVGDSYNTRFTFTASGVANNALVEVEFDIGSGSPIVIAGETKLLPRLGGTAARYAINMNLFALATFVANGCKIYFDSTPTGDNISVWDMVLFVKRDFTGTGI